MLMAGIRFGITIMSVGQFVLDVPDIVGFLCRLACHDVVLGESRAVQTGDDLVYGGPDPRKVDTVG